MLSKSMKRRLKQKAKNMSNPMKKIADKIDNLERAFEKNPGSMRKGAVKALSSSAGRTIGALVGQADLGAKAGSQLAKLFGHGDYEIKANSLMKNVATGSAFSKEGKRGTRIIEREYIGDVFSGTLSGSTTGFSKTTYNVNPTNSLAFPWLSTIANQYDQWEPHGIVFEFVSTSSEFNGVSQALGAVIMASDYDAYDPDYLSKQEMENSDYACSTKPANNLLHGVECDIRERPTRSLYTSTDNGVPLTSSTLSKLTVATQGCSTAGVNLGELWVSYDITFYKKQLYPLSLLIDFLNFEGTITNGGKYLENPSDLSGKVITANDNTIFFHNTQIGARYLISYYLYLNVVLADITALTSALVTSGCTLNEQVVGYTTSDAVINTIITTTAANASLLINATNALNTHNYRVNVVNVPIQTRVNF